MTQLNPELNKLLRSFSAGASTRFVGELSGLVSDRDGASVRVATLQGEITELLAKAHAAPREAGYWSAEAEAKGAELRLRLAEENLLAPGFGEMAIDVIAQSLIAGAKAAAPLAAELAIGALASRVG